MIPGANLYSMYWKTVWYWFWRFLGFNSIVISWNYTVWRKLWQTWIASGIVIVSDHSLVGPINTSPYELVSKLITSHASIFSLWSSWHIRTIVAFVRCALNSW